MKPFEKAVLLALDVMLNNNASMKERKELKDKAREAIQDALEKGGERWPESTNNW